MRPKAPPSGAWRKTAARRPDRKHTQPAAASGVPVQPRGAWEGKWRRHTHAADAHHQNTRPKPQVAGAEKTFDRDLWEGGAVKELASQADAKAMQDGVMVVYAPWCQFCQARGGVRDIAADFARNETDVT